MFPCWLRLVQETVKASLPWLCDAHILGEEDIIVPIISQWLSHCLGFSRKKFLHIVSQTDEQTRQQHFKGSYSYVSSPYSSFCTILLNECVTHEILRPLALNLFNRMSKRHVYKSFWSSPSSISGLQLQNHRS